MSIGEHEAAITQLRRNFSIIAAEALEEVGLDLLQDVQSRIQNEGKKADGSSLKPYSDSYLAFKKNPKGKRARDLGLGASRYSGVVDYTLTSRMWASIKVIPIAGADGSVGVRFASSEKQGEEKLRSLARRDKHNPLQPSKEEIDGARERFRDIIIDRIKRTL
jgi:hypothetical protein